MPFSVWLIPEEKHFGQFQELINRLAQENNSPTFVPHCTLVGKIVLDPIFSFAKIKTICNETKPISLSVSKLMSEKTLFKSLFIQIIKDKFVVDFQKKIANIFIKREPYHFDPHLSLMYKIVSDVKQKKITAGISLPDHINFDRISIVNTGETVDNWDSVFNQKISE